MKPFSQQIRQTMAACVVEWRLGEDDEILSSGFGLNWNWKCLWNLEFIEM